MTKVQKIWLSVFLAMFLVPEILWSPVGNTVYSFFQSGKIHPAVFRNNFLLAYQYEGLLKFVIFAQTLGIILSLFNIIKFRKNIGNSIFWPLVMSCFLLAIIAIFVFYLVIIFNPSFL
ncbi:MAG: hypothetical protein WC794_01935 [Candidatus Doudnabacteria bacterium]|jgi:hypothetical protein